MSTLDPEFFTLTRPAGPTRARFIGKVIDDYCYIRYWQLEPATGRRLPHQVVARFCSRHCICYLAEDYPAGCPSCKTESQTIAGFHG